MKRQTLSPLFFGFGPFDEEIEKKLLSRLTHPDRLMDALGVFLLEKGYLPESAGRLRAAYEGLKRDIFTGDSLAYLTHPLRVTAGFVSFLERPEPEKALLALCHNLKEKMGVDYRGWAERHLGETALHSIELLTIDRAREKDRGYLNEYYDGIARSAWPLMLLKSFDKLDNTLSWVRLDLEPYHAEIVLDFVCPRIAVSYPELELYLRQLTEYVGIEEVKMRFRARYAEPAWP